MRTAAPAEPVIVTITPAHVRVMHGSISSLVRRARTEYERRGDARTQVIVDLSELPTLLSTQVCAPLVKLLELLRGIAAAGVVVVGAASTVRPCLVAGLPDGVRVVDRTGRSWPQ